MPTRAFDVAIIGGGHNGLVCAAYLAKGGASSLTAIAHYHSLRYTSLVRRRA